jgi:Domain of unknown function (DUF4115)
VKHREQLRPLGFDEQRALEDLQKLHRDIQRARGDREQAEAEFDSFVKGFRAREPQPAPPHREPRPAAAPPIVAREARPDPPRPAPPPAAAPPAAAAAPPPAVAPMPAVHVAPPPLASPTPRQDVEPLWPAPGAVTPRADAAEDQPAHAAPSAVGGTKPAGPSAARRVPPLLAIGIAGLVLAVGFFAVFGGGDAPETVRNVPAGAAPREPEPQPAAAEPAQPAPAPPQSGVNLELITRRTVWVRVTVDGRREIERELPGGQRIPLHAEQSIVIRAGDAGAVAVRRGNGAEVGLGEDGIVANRTFTAERRSESPPQR